MRRDGVAIVEDGRVRSNLLSSQTDLHARFGGVVPELASRQHLVSLNILLAQALDEAGVAYGDLDGIAVTVGPGLVGACSSACRRRSRSRRFSTCR